MWANVVEGLLTTLNQCFEELSQNIPEDWRHAARGVGDLTRLQMKRSVQQEGMPQPPAVSEPFRPMQEVAYQQDIWGRGTTHYVHDTSDVHHVVYDASSTLAWLHLSIPSDNGPRWSSLIAGTQVDFQNLARTSDSLSHSLLFFRCRTTAQVS